jgi:hypothetical protein
MMMFSYMYIWAFYTHTNIHITLDPIVNHAYMHSNIIHVSTLNVLNVLLTAPNSYEYFYYLRIKGMSQR